MLPHRHLFHADADLHLSTAYFLFHLALSTALRAGWLASCDGVIIFRSHSVGRFCDLDLGDRFQERGTNYRQNEIKEKGDEKGEGGMQQRMMRD